MVTMNGKPHEIPVTTVNGTEGREALPEHWVAALVQSRHEKMVSKRLHDLQIENYVPTQWEVHQWSDRKKKVEVIVIPMIVFIRSNAPTRRRLITYSFIHKLLTLPGKNTPAFIPEAQIERLKFMLRHAESTVEMHDHVFKTGDQVRIVRGPLKDLEGELCRVESDKPMVAVRIDCLGYACVSIEKSDLEIISA